MGTEVVLYDQTGTPIPLPGPPTPPSSSVGMVPFGVDGSYRDRFRGYPSRNLTPAKITQILDQADQGWPLEWIELCEEVLEKDPKINSVFHTRSAAVLGLYYEVQPPKLDDVDEGDDQLAQDISRFCDQALNGCNLNEMVGDMLDALAKPFAVDWIDWKFNRDGKVVPQRFRRIPTKHLHWSFNSDTIRVFDPFMPIVNSGGGQLGAELPPYTTTRALYNVHRDHPARGGLMRTLVWYYLFKGVSLKDMVSYGDRFGMPVRIAALDSADFKDPAFVSKIRSALLTMGSDGSGVISKNTDLQIHASGANGGADLFQAIIDYLDKAIAWLVLGHELTSQGARGGGNLGISAALQVRQDILEGDCNFISGIIKRDVLTPMVGWNFGWDVVERGLVPNLTYNYEPPKDLVAQVNVLSVLAKTFPSLTFSKQQMRDEYGVDEPLNEVSDGTPDDDVLMPASGAGADSKAPAAATIPIGTPEVSINADAAPPMTLAARRRRLPGTVYKKSRQRAIDTLAARGIKTGMATTAAWGRQLRDLLREAAKDGLSMQEVGRRLVKAYPDLDPAALQKTLHEQMLLVRLFGRNS